MKPANYRPYSNRKASQSGSTLIISMIILILLMMLGVTAMKTSDTQFQLAGNLQFEDSAMNNAEIAVNFAETAMTNGTVIPLPSGAIASGKVPNAAFTTLPYVPSNGPTADGLYPINANIDPFTLNWTGTGGNGNDMSITVANGQNYIVELMSQGAQLQGSGATIGGRASAGCNTVNTYRITARGTSARGAIKFVQSFYSVLNC